MERRKTKIFGICISFLLVLSIVLALFCVFNTGTLGGGNSSNLDTEANTVASYSPDKYLGGIGNSLVDYMDLKGYETNANWKAISSEQNLKDFLRQTNGYSGYHGYLTQDISLTWAADRAYMAPNITLDGKNLDGCGFKITLKGGSNGVELDRRNDSQVGVILPKEGDGYGMQEGTANDGTPIYYKVDYHCFGGLVSVLTNKSTLSNFTFVIEDNHYFGYKDSNNNDWNDSGDDALAIVGGLVGYNKGGNIDNVVVQLASGKKFGAYEDVSSKGNSISKFGCTNAVYLGLVVGASSGGKISNISTIFSTNSTLQTVNRTGWIRKWDWTQPKSHPGASFVGGVAGYIMGGTIIDNAYAEFNNGCRLIAEVNSARYENASGSSGDFQAFRKVGGIVAINKGGQVLAAMVSGNLDCMVTGGNSKGGSGDDASLQQIKNIYVAEGTEPGTKIYKNATGGTDTEGNDGSGSVYNKGYAEVKFAKLTTNGSDNGYGGREIPFYFDHDANNSVKIFIPDGYILWNLYGQAVFGQLNAGEYSAMRYPTEGTSTEIQIGINSSGEIGIYKHDQVNGTEILAVDDGTRWIEMSDQSRKARNGNVDSPLYYDGTKYELKMKINGRLYDNGIRIINVGDLKNAMNRFNGRPVKLYCDDGGDYDNAIAYSSDEEKIVIMLKNVTVGMDRILSIQKRSLVVETDENYVRGETTIFGGAYVQFNKLSDDSQGIKSGLANGDLMMWQDQGYPEGEKIYLNVAGRQMIRPSTNNYELYTEEIFGQTTRLNEVGTYFSAIIQPHQIKVHESIYINGAAVSGVNADTKLGTYNIMSNRDFGNTDKNNEKRTITIAGRLNDGHFGATRIALYDKNGKEIPVSWDTVNGLMTTTFTVENDNLDKIDFVGYYSKKYTVTATGGTVSSIAGVLNEETNIIEYSYGDKVTIKANEAEKGKIFVGWLRADNVTYLTYKSEYSFKVNDNYELTAVYEDIEASKPWTQIYLDNLGNEIRVRKAVNEAVDMNYKLPGRMGYTFREWSEVSRDNVNKIITFKAMFDETVNSPKVRVVYDNKNSVLTNYGAPITLEANTTYLVNGTLVETKNEAKVIYAITDLNIEKINKVTFPGVIKKQSMTYTSFLLDGTYYISATFVYGTFDAKYNTEDNKPRLGMTGFSINDVTEYVRQGNVYQISIVVTAQELECRFGNNAEIATFLSILTDEKDEGTGDYKKDENGNDIVKYQFEEIMIFKRKD